MRDPYDVLGIRSTATEAELKSAYRLLAKRFHPDADPGNSALADRFKEVTAAYEFLKDPIKRSRFDRGEIDATGAFRRRGARSYGRDRRNGTASHRSQTAGASAQRNGTRTEAPNGAAGRNRTSGAGDTRSAGGQSSWSSRQNAANQNAAKERAAKETSARDNAGRDNASRDNASRENGEARRSRAFPDDDTRETEEAVRSRYQEIFADFFSGTRERQAGGDGQRLDQTYRISITFEEAALGGKRRVRLTGDRTVDVTIPPGVKDGQQIRLKGMGRSSGSVTGDALLRLEISPHPFYKREENDIHVTVPVTLVEAVVGAKVMVPTLNGVVHLTIPPGANTGTTLRLRGRGIQPEKASAPGDQLVTLQIVLPEDPPKDFVKTIRKWADKWPGGSVRRHLGLEK